MGTGAFSEIEIDTTRGIVPPPLLPRNSSAALFRIHLPLAIAALTSAATPSIYLFARGSYAARCLVSRARRRDGTGEEGKNEREGLPKVENAGTARGVRFPRVALGL